MILRQRAHRHDQTAIRTARECTDVALEFGRIADADQAYRGPSRSGNRGEVTQVCQRTFGAFVESGILAHGFVRLRCTEWAREKLVAFLLSPALLRDSCYVLD